MAAIKVGIVGAGGVGTALGKQLGAKAAFTVKYGVRDVNAPKVATLLAAQPKASVDTVLNTTAWAEVVILAVPGSNDDAGIQAIAASLGPGAAGKPIIDATNPLTPWPGLEVRWTTGTSGGEALAAALPDSFVFKAFNTLGENLMHVPDGSTITGEQLRLLYAGPEDKRDLVAKVIEGTGFEPLYVGPIRYARNLEAIAELWIHLGVPGLGTSAKWGRDFHFQAIRGPSST